MGERLFTFTVDWRDPHAGVARSFLLLYHPDSSEVELLDARTRKPFLRRCRHEGLALERLYPGATLSVCSRMLQVTGYADSHTSATLERLHERSLLLVELRGVQTAPECLQAVTAAGFGIRNLRLVWLAEEEAEELSTTLKLPKLEVGLTDGPMLAVELQRQDAVAELCNLVYAYPATLDGRRPWSTPQTAHAAAQGLDLFFTRLAGYTQQDPPNPGTRTLCLVKPHASHHVGDVWASLRDNGLVVTAGCSCQLSPSRHVRLFEVYRGVLPPSEFGAMVEQLVGGTCIALEVSSSGGSNPVNAVRTVCGPRIPGTAKLARPQSLRARFGIDTARNCVHCTDLEEDGDLECGIIFEEGG